MEIERKFRLNLLPPPQVLGNGIEVVQGYLFTEEGELRVRAKGDRYFLAVKGNGNISRDEWEVEIPEWIFKTLWPKTQGRRMEKTRYSIPHHELTIEVDEYHGDLTELVTLECEFPREEAAHNFVLPAWAASAVEVTNDNAYKNKNLAVHGLPNERRKHDGTL